MTTLRASEAVILPQPCEGEAQTPPYRTSGRYRGCEVRYADLYPGVGLALSGAGGRWAWQRRGVFAT
ncbi:MAG: hypothetical protein WBV59_19555 [Anaerolineae bacterium]